MNQKAFISVGHADRTWWSILLAALLFAVAPLAQAQHTVPKQLPELVAEAEWIVVARLESARSRWNGLRTLIVTDHEFEIEQVLLGEPGAGPLVLSQGGGEVGGERHALSSNPKLHLGTRYLLFVGPERGEVFSPFVSGAYGVVRVQENGRAVSLSGTEDWWIDDLLDLVGDLVTLRAGAPPRVYVPDRDRDVVYPAKTYLPASKPEFDPAGARVPAREAEDEAPAGEAAAGSEGHATAAPAGQQGSGLGRYFYPISANAPIVFDEFPHEWSWSPHDQYELSRWNHYAGSLFLISGTTLNTWAWGNGRFELVGWPDNATMIAQFGEGWGANTLAVCWQQWNASNVLIEADIALNPAFNWTLDKQVGASTNGTTWHFGQTMLHEIGHSWGLDHPWETQDVWWDSVMNYPPKRWRRNRLNADDTNAVRSRYGGPARTDALLSLYRTSDTAANNHATYTDVLPSGRTIYHGQSISLGTLQVENVGTTTISNPRVDLYLSQNWEILTGGYTLLRTLNYTHTLPTFYTMTGGVGATTVPGTVPTGLYYLTGRLNITDSVSANNLSSAHPDARITVLNNPVTLAPIEAWRTAPLGRIGPSGTWNLNLPVVAGRTYELSLCPGSGGSANFDTVLQIMGTGGVTNDDHCGLQSRILWTAPSTGVRQVQARGYSVNSQGNFTLAYRQVVTDRIFANGFQN